MSWRNAPGGEAPPEQVEVECVACQGPLYFLHDAYPLAFYCGNGHVLTLEDLLDDLLAQGKNPPASIMQFWQEKALHLRRMSERALQNGHALTAADLLEAVHRVDHWVSTLRTLLPGGTTRKAPALDQPSVPLSTAR